MPPKLALRRPAGFGARAKAKPKPAPKPAVRNRGRKRPAVSDPSPNKEGEEGTLKWIQVGFLNEDTFPLKSLLKMRLVYLDEAGELVGKLVEIHRDVEGRWFGLEVQGTNIPSLRTWCLEHPGPNQFLYVSYQDVRPEERLSVSNVAYLKEACRITEITDVWGKNCQGDLPKEGDKVETGPLQELAKQFGLPSHLPQGQGAKDTGGGAREPDENEEKGKVKEKKRRRGSRLVKEMLEKAVWRTQGTPLDPHYRKPIHIKLKGPRHSSTSSSSGSSSAGSSSIENDHPLRKVAKKLPGYLTRKSCKEAAVVLAQSTVGETPDSFVVFRRYYRQILLSKTSSRAIQREMLTLSCALDSILSGNILAALDIMSQRLKALELLTGGSPADLANQVEVLPKELTGLSSAAESRVAQREYHAELKLAKAMKGKGKAPPTEAPYKGDPPKGKQKGLKGSKSEPKGGKASESQVVKV